MRDELRIHYAVPSLLPLTPWPNFEPARHRVIVITHSPFCGHGTENREVHSMRPFPVGSRPDSSPSRRPGLTYTHFRCALCLAIYTVEQSES